MQHDTGVAAAKKDRRSEALLAGLSRNRDLVVITVLAVIITCVVACVSMLLTVTVDECDLLSRHLATLPGLLDERLARFEDMSDEYMEDCTVKSDIGALLFEELTEYEGAERLEQIRSSISATDVSLVEADGTIALTTRTGRSFSLGEQDILGVLDTEEGVLNRFSDLLEPDDTDEMGEDVLESLAETGHVEPDVETVLKYFNLDSFPPLLLAKRLPSGRTLVFEYDYTNIGTYSIEQTGWEVLLKDMLAGLDACAFVRYDDDGYLACYPLDPELLKVSEEDASKFFSDDAPHLRYANFGHTDVPGDMRFGVMRIAGTNRLLMRTAIPEYGVKAIIAVPLDRLTAGVKHATVALGVFVALSLVMLLVFLRRTKERELIAGRVVTVRRLRAKGAGGFGLMLVATIAFFCMLVLLEVMASTASVTKEQRESLEYQIDYDTRLYDQERAEYVARGVSRCNALAQMLSSSPRLRDRETLMRLDDVVGAQCLMLFDKEGRQTISSTSFGGIGDAEDEDATADFQRILTGCPYVVTETVHDDVLGTDTHAVASLVTDGEGLTDGFLAMRVDDGAIAARLAGTSLESIIASYPVEPGQAAMVVDDESGKIIAHTKRSLAGEPVDVHLDSDLVGHDFEGFTFYDGTYAYLSENSDGIRSVLLVTSSATALAAATVFGAIVIAAIVALLVLYFALATRIIARRELGTRRASRSNPLAVFGRSYVAYFFLLSIFAFVNSRLGRWPSFDFVFGSQWSRGIHLFSIWAMLFGVCTASTLVLASRAMLERLEGLADVQARTLLRLASSVVTYGSVFVCGFWVLSMLGVDTTALLASAGIASIAIGMGSQGLITDILAGVFLVFEGSIRVGDIVTVGTWRGTVTDMGVRTCEITDESHDVKIITNSRITEIVNMSRRKTVCSSEVEFKRTVEVDEVPALVDEIIAGVVAEVPELESSLRMEDITKITEDAYTVRLTYKVDERDRESVTFRLNNALQLLLEGGTEELEEAAGIVADEGPAEDTE